MATLFAGILCVSKHHTRALHILFFSFSKQHSAGAVPYRWGKWGLERLCNWPMVVQPASGRAGIQTCACPNTVVSTSNCFWQENNRLKLHCGKCFAFYKKKIFLFNIFKFKIQKEINTFLWLPGKTINTSEKAGIGNPAGTGTDCCTPAILVTHCQTRSQEEASAGLAPREATAETGGDERGPELETESSSCFF